MLFIFISTFILLMYCNDIVPNFDKPISVLLRELNRSGLPTTPTRRSLRCAPAVHGERARQPSWSHDAFE
jgi:hypothetical protein